MRRRVQAVLAFAAALVMTVSVTVSYGAVVLKGGSGETASRNESVAADATAAPDETIAAAEIGYDGMVPVPGSLVADGDYEISVDSSSSMFRVASCTLHAEGGKMTARLVMGGNGYSMLYMGTPEEAAADVPHAIMEEDDAGGTSAFTVPVEALDQETDCAAFSRKKEKWYGRTLVFRADSLPVDAILPEYTALDLADGEYLAEVSLGGGSGRASVTSPAAVTVKDGAAVARIEWSSPNYDYMVVRGEKYLAVNDGGNSVFEIPVPAFDVGFPVKADTTAMSVPHEISYTLVFDGASVVPAKKKTYAWPLAGAACAGILAAVLFMLRGRKRKAS